MKLWSISVNVSSFLSRSRLAVTELLRSSNGTTEKNPVSIGASGGMM
ncbi:MAG: hypothetical protein JOZ52_14675 [Acidobacteria bacterium]|nr:hypothetical protein [Acidobacteriota bacterium]